MGSKNHEIVPTALIVQISGLRNGGVNKNLGELAKRNLVARVRNAKCASHSREEMSGKTARPLLRLLTRKTHRRWIQVDIWGL